MDSFLFAQVPPGIPGQNLTGMGISLRGTIEQQLIYLDFNSERQDLINGVRIYRIPEKEISKYPMFPGLSKDSIGPYMNIGGSKLRFVPTDPTGSTLVLRSWTAVI
jgi:hypothetical protein